MIFDFIHWNVRPEIIEGFSVRWYGLLFASAFFFGYLIFQKIFKWENIEMKVLDRLTMYMVFGTVIGARLGHCLFYEPGYYLANPWEILFVWHGGLASHGAAIGIIIALWLFSQKEKIAFSWILDRIVIVVALAGALIRTGNLMNSEIVGAPTSVPWAFVFDRLDQQPRHPAQLYEALSYFAIFILLFILYRKNFAQTKPWFLFGIFLTSVFGIRFFVEFVKDVQVDFEKGMALDMGQWLSIPFFILGVFLIFKNVKKAHENSLT